MCPVLDKVILKIKENVFYFIRFRIIHGIVVCNQRTRRAFVIRDYAIEVGIPI